MLDKKEIATVLDKMAGKMVYEFSQGEPLALVGIRDRGEILAGRLAKLLQNQSMQVDLGMLDITLYRDDLHQKGTDQPAIQATEIDFDIDGRTVILVDDVLGTGRTIRAAMDALMALGRPQVIRLAVLIDRGHRELPIRPDYVGQRINVNRDQQVKVFLEGMDETDKVIVE
jgi:pyrimidine operon attenuation protein/uracil phosphoribosyltransferase